MIYTITTRLGCDDYLASFGGVGASGWLILKNDDGSILAAYSPLHWVSCISRRIT